MKLPVVFAASLVLSTGGLLAQDKTPAPNDPIVELPKFIVTDSRELPQPESWRYGTIQGFEILTNASDKATQRLLRDFDMFRQALGYVWPVPDKIAHSTSLIICGKGAKFDQFVPSGKSASDFATASLFLRKEQQAAIVIDLQATTLNVLNVDDSNDAATGTDSGLISVEHDKQLYREYVRYLMSQNEPRSPAWLEEGLSQIIMKMQFEKRYIEFAKLEDPNTISVQASMNLALNAASTEAGGEEMALPGAPAEDRDFAAALRRKALVPLDKFFAVKHDAPEAMNPLGNNRWAKQAYAFVHMCLYAKPPKYQKPFMTFLQRSAKEGVSEALFKECFKMTYKQMLMEIRGYCDFTAYEAKLLKSVKGGPDLIVSPPPVTLREATQAEIGRIKGEALVLAGHSKEAHTEFTMAYRRGERDPYLLASLGLYDTKNNEPERGRKFLEAAFAAKAKRPEACLELAKLRYAEAMAKPAGPDGRFSAAQVAGVLAPLRLVRGMPPHLPALYDLAGDTLMRSPEKSSHEDAVFVVEGAQLFPLRLKLVYQAMVVAADAGELQAAHALADHGIKFAPEGPARKRFEEMKATLPPAPPAPAEPAEAAKKDAPAKK